MMHWVRTNSTQGAFPIGKYLGCFLTLTFDSTACGPSGSTVAGQTFDPTNNYTTKLQWNTADAVLAAGGTVTGTTLEAASGLKHLVQALCLEDSSSATAKASGANTTSAVVKLTFSAVIQGFVLGVEGNATADAGLTADPATMRPEALMANTAGAMAGLSFRMLVIGR